LFGTFSPQPFFPLCLSKRITKRVTNKNIVLLKSMESFEEKVCVFMDIESELHALEDLCLLEQSNDSEEHLTQRTLYWESQLALLEV